MTEGTAAADFRPAKRNFNAIRTVLLYVGDDKTEFHVHEDLLCEASHFFEAAFTSNFWESLEKSMTLPEDDVELFNDFVQWLYHQRYVIPPSDLNMEKKGGYFTQTMQLYVLADKYGVTSLKNSIVDVLFVQAQITTGTPGLKSVGYLYNNTRPTSRIRAMITDWYTSYVSPKWFQESGVRRWLVRHPEFAADLVASFANLNTIELRKSLFKNTTATKYYDEVDTLHGEAS